MARIADRAKNVRRMGQRRIEALRLDMQVTRSDSRRQEIQTQIDEVSELIKQTRAYENGKLIRDRTQQERLEAVEKLESLSKSLPTRARNKAESVKRSNLQKIQEIRIASRGQDLDTATEIQARSFMRATQRAWEGKSGDRYELIMEYYGTRDLNEIWDAVMSLNANEINLLEKMSSDIPLTQEEKKLMQDLKRTDDEQEKRYKLSGTNSPIVGSIASLIKELPQDALR